MWSGLVIAMLAGAGCDRLGGEAMDQLQHADRAYRTSQYEIAERSATFVIRNAPSNPDTAEAYYIRGLSRLRMHHRASARADFEIALRRTKRQDLRSLLELQLANIHFDDNSYARAAGFYQHVVEVLPENVPAGPTWYRLGVSLQRIARFDRARAAFKQALEHRVDANLAAHCQRAISWMGDYFAIQCGAYSDGKRAREAANDLRHSGVQAEILRQPHVTKAPYLVLAGRYRDYSAARKALTRVQRVQTDAFMVP
jgi:tetratricopeptide (TPR) repeat protein